MHSFFFLNTTFKKEKNNQSSILDCFVSIVVKSGKA